ncbi:MAG: Gfo/Idh/MocA family oxidoreductase [Fimbriimonadaceae bacterium]|nr:Gfo/Idh/MocA family oxidoreductase [Fimbriimonadaceae bacterium]
MSNKVKIGLIGTGGIARGAHIPGFLLIPDECEVVWLADPSEDALQQARELVPGARTTSDYHEILRDSEVDAVAITTPNLYHLQPTLDAFAAGKHVLCEKPLAMNAAEGRQMVNAGHAAGKILMVAFQNRFCGEAQFLKRYIDLGKMGEIYYARAHALRRRGVPHWGVFIDKEKQGGGPLIDIGVHVLDLTLWLMGNPKPVSASGATYNRLGRNPDLFNGFGEYDHTKFTVEDFAAGFIRFDNGATVSLESSFMANIERSPFEAHLLGTEAGAEIALWENARLNIYREDDQQMFDLTPRNIPHVPSPHTVEMQTFVRAVAEGKPSPIPGEHGLMLNAIFDALYRSAETGREEPVNLHEG